MPASAWENNDDEAADARIGAVVGAIGVEIVELAARDLGVAVVTEVVAGNGLVRDHLLRDAVVGVARPRRSILFPYTTLFRSRLLRLADDVLARLEPAQRVGAGAGRGR